MKKKKRPKVGLALGSGGAKGLSHIGVIKVLVENKIPIDYIAGSSIGALIGGVYATNKNIFEIEKVISETNLKKVFSLIDPALRSGLIGGNKVRIFVEKQTGRKDFKDLLIPLAVIATDLKNGETVIFKKGSVASAIRASISFPLLFKPVKIKSRMLGDGGLSLPIPARVVREMGADIVIAVNLDNDYFREEYPGKKLGFYKVAGNSLNILRFHLAKYNTYEADITILPKTGRVRWSKFIKGEDVVLQGEKAMKKRIKDLKKLIESN